jgi:hypothetical protein
MKALLFSLTIVGTTTIAGILAGCSGSQSQISGAMPNAVLSRSSFGAPGVTHTLFAPHPDHRKSWMKREATRIKKLLYVSDGSTSVDVYNYANGNLEGTLAGFEYPTGQCVDANGDVYIANVEGDSVEEFPHGGVRPVRTLTADGYPVGCSVAPNGSIAVNNYDTYRSGLGNVEVFPSGSGKPTIYPGIGPCRQPAYVGYDNENELFVEGESAYYNNGICYLNAGASSISVASFNENITTAESLGVMWDGTHIALSYTIFLGPSQSNPSSVIYRATVSGSGSVLTAIGSTTLNGCPTVGSPFLVGEANTPVNTHRATRVIGQSEGTCRAFNSWAYPAGGDPIGTFAGVSSNGASVSIAAK